VSPRLKDIAALASIVIVPPAILSFALWRALNEAGVTRVVLVLLVFVALGLVIYSAFSGTQKKDAP
jgi:hypothetical protein